MQNYHGIKVISVDDYQYHKQIQKYINDREMIVIYLLDVVEHYKEKIKFIEDQYKNYFICTAGPYDHPKNLITLDPLLECQRINKDIYVDRKNEKIYDFLFMPGKNQIWRLELTKELLAQGLLDNSLWSLSNPPGTVVDIIEKKMPKDYELEGFDLSKEVYEENSKLNRILVPKQYEDSRCSIVCETTLSNDRVYLTEKTWKPLLAGHPFVAQANPGYHDYLKLLGFKTFSNLWTEQHDNIHGLAEVCSKIKGMDIDYFVDNTREIVMHNQNLARSQDWIKEYHLEQLHSKKII